MSLPPPIIYVPILAIAAVCAIGGRILKSRPRLSDALAILFAIGLFLVFALGFGGGGTALLIQGIHRHNGIAIWISVPFVLIGAAAAAGVIFGGPFLVRNARIKAAHPEEPWLWESDWASGQVPDHAAGGAVGAWLWAGIWNGMTYPAVFGAMQKYLHTHDAKLLIVWLFAAVGAWLLVGAVRATVRAAHFGKSVLVLQTLPASPGAALAGSIHIARPLRPTGPIRLHLLCIRTVRNGENATQMTQWEDEQQLEGLPPTAAGTDIPVYFALPADVSPTNSADGSRQKIDWRLDVTAPAAEVNYSTKFKIPVFHASNPAKMLPPDSARKFRRPVGQLQPADLKGITLSRLSDGGCVIHLAAARNPGVAVFLTVMAAAMTGVAAVFLHVDPPIWVKIVAAGFGVGTALGAINAWLASATITARPQGLSIDRGLPLLRRQRDIPRDAISDVAISILNRSQFGRTTFYTLEARLDGKSSVIARGIAGKREAECLVNELNGALGIQTAGQSEAAAAIVST